MSIEDPLEDAEEEGVLDLLGNRGARLKVDNARTLLKDRQVVAQEKLTDLLGPLHIDPLLEWTRLRASPGYGGRAELWRWGRRRRSRHVVA